LYSFVIYQISVFTVITPHIVISIVPHSALNNIENNNIRFLISLFLKALLHDWSNKNISVNTMDIKQTIIKK
jgi:hypothetical protein